MRHDVESCDQGREDQNGAWLDKPITSVKGKLKPLKRGTACDGEQDLAPMDQGNGEEQVRSRLMNQYGHVMI